MPLDLTGFNNQQLFFGTFFALQNKIQRMGDRFYKEMTLKQFFVVLVLQLFGNYQPTLKELSDVAGSSYQNIKQIILKLEKHNIVEIINDGSDKRKMRIKMTEKCKALLDQYDEKAQEFLNILFAGVAPNELESALTTLRKMDKNLMDLS